MTLGDWMEENPKARPLLMFGLFALVLLMVGVLLGLGKKKKDPLISEMPDVTTRTHTTVASVPTGGGDEKLGQPAQGRKVAFIRDKDAPGKLDRGLNVADARKFKQWEEVSWIQEEDGWDKVRGDDGQELWVESKHVVFTRPANLDKPSDAEVTIMDFYQAVARKDYGAAYNYLSPAWKTELSFNRFVEGYSKTLSLRTEITRVTQLAPDRYQVDVSMTADEVGKDVPYAGSYVIEKAEDHWDMTSGSLTRTSPPDRPERQLPNIAASPQPEATSSAPVATPTSQAPVWGVPDRTLSPAAPVATPSDAPVVVPGGESTPSSATTGF